MAISSRHNTRFRDALALRDARERRRRRELLLDGAREITRALDGGLAVREAWVAPERVHSDAAREAIVALGRAGTEIVEAAPELLDRLAYGDRDEGVVAIVAAPPTELDRLSLPADPLVAVLDGVEKPGNLGAVVRSADGAGVDAVVLTDPASDPWNPNAIRASMGTLFGMPLAVSTAPEAIAWLRAREVSIVTARVDADLDYDRIDLRSGVAVVLGSEAAGLGQVWTGPDVTAVRVPMLGRADSLNVSATAAILFYEARRQRMRQRW